MHELGITRNIVAICADHAAGRRVLRVTLQIGELSAIVPDAVRFCFGVVAQGTVVEHATLEIEQSPGRGECRSCHETFELHQPYGRCTACGSPQIRVIAGEELKVREMEVE